MDIEPSSPPELEPGGFTPPRPRFQLNVLRQIVFQPRQAFSEIVAREKRATWLLPVILIVALVAVAALVSAQDTTGTSLASANRAARSTQASTQQARTTATPRANRSGQGQANQEGGGAFPGGPGDFQGGPPPDLVISGDFGGPFGGVATGPGGASAQSGSATTTTPRNVWLSVLLPVGSFIVTWLILGGLTNLLSLAFGGHSNALMAINIAAWASIPIGVRNIMQVIYYLATGSAIQRPGLSGFAPAANGNNLLIFLQHLLSRVDIYLFWQMALVGIGVAIWGGLARKKSIPIAILSVGIIILLQSLLGTGLELLGNVNINTNMLLRLR